MSRQFTNGTSTRVEAAARALLGEDAVAALRSEGRRLGMKRVMRLQLGEDGAE